MLRSAARGVPWRPKPIRPVVVTYRLARTYSNGRLRRYTAGRPAGDARAVRDCPLARLRRDPPRSRAAAASGPARKRLIEPRADSVLSPLRYLRRL